MRYCYCWLLMITMLACGPQKDPPPSESDSAPGVAAKPAEVQKEDWQTILDSAGLEGSILLFDPQKNRYFSNDFEWAREASLPASTFKIPNSIIALETGVVEDDSTLFAWNGEPRSLAIWEQDLIFREAFHRSCVPCYQDIARRVGVVRMNDYLKRFDYGDMQVDSSNIDLFWLEGASKISQWSQIDFLQRFYTGELPISERTYQLMRELMVIEESTDNRLSGKSGWAIREGHNTGWFVGYVERAAAVYFFATRVMPKESRAMGDFASLRRKVTEDALKAHFKD